MYEAKTERRIVEIVRDDVIDVWRKGTTGREILEEDGKKKAL
jgi:hypothetical protein